jgi:hypothetical protein
MRALKSIWLDDWQVLSWACAEESICAVFPTKYLMMIGRESIAVISIHELKQILMLLLDYRKLLTFLFLTGKMSSGSSFFMTRRPSPGKRCKPSEGLKLSHAHRSTHLHLLPSDFHLTSQIVPITRLEHRP